MRSVLRLAARAGLALTISLSTMNAVLPADAESGSMQGAPSSSPLPPLAPAVKKSGPWDDVNERMTRIEHRIVEAVSSGRLDSLEAKTLRTELDRIAEMQAVFRSLPVTTAYFHSLALNYELDQLTDNLERSMRDRQVVPADFDFLKEDTLKRIDKAAQSGRLTKAEVASLKQEYNRITGLEHLLIRTGGRLSYADKLMLAVDLDHLNSAIRRQISPMNVKMVDVSAIAQSIEKRTDDALGAGHINAEIAKAIKGQLAEVKETAEKEKAKNGKQAIAIGLWLESISNRLDHQIQVARNTMLTVQERSAQLDRRIAQALIDGRLTPLEALELREDLDTVRSQFKSAPAPEEEFVFNLALARLEGLTDRQLHGPSLVWPGVLAYHAHIDTRIKHAASATRLSGDEAKSLKLQSDALAESMRKAGGPAGISDTNRAIALAVGLQQLSAKLEKDMKDRPMAQPDIDSLYSAIDRRIGDAVVSGQLNMDEGRSAAEELAAVAALRQRYKQRDGSLTGRELWSVGFELQRASARLEELIHDHPALFPGLEVRRAQIDELISEGVSSGRLSDSEATNFKEIIAQNVDSEKQLRSTAPGFTSSQGLELVGTLERQHGRLERLLRDRHVPASDLVAIQGRVERKIARFFSLGYLSLAEAESLRRQYDSVISAMRHMRAIDGGLSYGEKLAFLYGFERLAAATERNARTTPLPLPNLLAKHAEVEQKIANALASGRLAKQEALDLRGLLDEIGRSHARSRQSGGGLSYPEAIVAIADVDRLSGIVDLRMAAVKQPLPDIDTRRTQLHKKIEDAKARGKLSALQEQQLRGELDRIAEGEVAFRLTDEALSFAEAINLVQDLERVNERLEQILRQPAVVPKVIKQQAGKRVVRKRSL